MEKYYAVMSPYGSLSYVAINVSEENPIELYEIKTGSKVIREITKEEFDEDNKEKDYSITINDLMQIKQDLETSKTMEEKQDIVDTCQDILQLRVCPRNIYQDETAKSICPVCQGKPCRKRFWTCWKKYYKALDN